MRVQDAFPARRLRLSDSQQDSPIPVGIAGLRHKARHKISERKPNSCLPRVDAFALISAFLIVLFRDFSGRLAHGKSIDPDVCGETRSESQNHN